MAGACQRARVFPAPRLPDTDTHLACSCLAPLLEAHAPQARLVAASQSSWGPLLEAMAEPAPQEAPSTTGEGEQVIDPWSVSGGADGKIDYNKLLEQVWCYRGLADCCKSGWALPLACRRS
mgnify:CR=1 FL=1